MKFLTKNSTGENNSDSDKEHLVPSSVATQIPSTITSSVEDLPSSLIPSNGRVPSGVILLNSGTSPSNLARVDKHPVRLTSRRFLHPKDVLTVRKSPIDPDAVRSLSRGAFVDLFRGQGPVRMVTEPYIGRPIGRPEQSQAPRSANSWSKKPWPDGKERTFSPQSFIAEIRNSFIKWSQFGYSIGIRHGNEQTFWSEGYGRGVYDYQSNQGDPLPNFYMTENVVLSTGSAEKILTAIVATRMLEAKGRTTSEPIYPYLPKDYWPASLFQYSLDAGLGFNGKGGRIVLFRDLLRMRSGALQRVGALGLKIQDGYPWLQVDVNKLKVIDGTPMSPGEVKWMYSNGDTNSARYALAGLFGMPRPSGPLNFFSIPHSDAWLADYNFQVGKFMADLEHKFVFQPCGVTLQQVNWGYPGYGLQEGMYGYQQIPKTLPLYYPTWPLDEEPDVDFSEGNFGWNEWVFDHRRGSGHGALTISTRNWLKVIALIADGHLVSNEGRSRLLERVDSSVNGAYASCMFIIEDQEGGLSASHGGDTTSTAPWSSLKNGGTSIWMIFPYANIQIVIMLNAYPRPFGATEGGLMSAFRKSFSPSIPWYKF